MKSHTEVKTILSGDGEAYLYRNFFCCEEANALFISLRDTIDWKHEPIWMFGKKVMQPRLTAWYGDEGKTYRYSGILMKPIMWTAGLIEVKNKIEEVTGAHFNSALLNLYRDGKDSMGWHRDNEPELGLSPVIASVSFGDTRRFLFRRYLEKKIKTEVSLENGSLLLMRGEAQTHWEHSIPKTAMSVAPRINITFRKII